MSGQEPLLLKESFSRKRHVLLSSAKWILRGVIWLVFIAWVALIFVFPSPLGTTIYLKWRQATGATLFGTKGSLFLLFGAPILLIAFLGIAYLVLCGEEGFHGNSKSSRQPRIRLWTFPVLVDGPFGVVSAAEMIGIVLFVAYIIWAICIQTAKITNDMSCAEMLEQTGLHLGNIGIYCLAFLFLPIARGSVLLQLIDIPFEHATKYHVWLGHFTMGIFTIHGLLYLIGWTMEGQLLSQLEWKNIGFAHFPGVISLLSGLLIWVTSLPGVRRLNFELFFYTHQLYVVFVVSLAMHVGDFVFTFVSGGIFLFMLDRFLRFCQSRRTVNIVSARTFPCGAMELVLSKPANLQYNSLGWIFLQIRELSWVQWHPFSVSSSPLDGKHHIAILIKGLGDWTKKLERRISSASNELTASVEGPYGHRSPYYLEYENLILVAGGIGISPFLAILSDILQRIKKGMVCLPRNVLLVWAVKTSDELPLLKIVDMDPSFSNTFNLEIQAYVTRESEPQLEEAKSTAHFSSFTCPLPTTQRISVLAGTGNIVWSGIYVIVSTVGLVVTVALLDIFYINPYVNPSYLWYKGLLLFLCMLVSVLIFGGLVIGLWHCWDRKTSLQVSENIDENGTVREYEPKIYASEQYTNTVMYGQRPNFEGIFESMASRWGSVDIGVIVCGPSSLQTSVARECRTQNLGRRDYRAIFHFNSHSFDL